MFSHIGDSALLLVSLTIHFFVHYENVALDMNRTRIYPINIKAKNVKILIYLTPWQKHKTN